VNSQEIHKCRHKWVYVYVYSSQQVDQDKRDRLQINHADTQKHKQIQK